jgi:hypothetical protein
MGSRYGSGKVLRYGESEQINRDSVKENKGWESDIAYP